MTYMRRPWSVPVTLRNVGYLTALSLIIALGGACGGGTEPEAGPPPIPLDGRGGGVIAYAHQPGGGTGVHEIYAINADGTGNTRISDAQIGLNHHDWSPDAQQLTAVGYVSQATWSIHVLDADGGNLRRLTNTPGVWDNEPTWSPDGTEIAFTRIYPSQGERVELWVMNADGSDQRWIGVEGIAARWSPDGDRFVYASSLRSPSDIYTCNVDGTDIQQVTATAASESAPVWSPDGSLIAFVSDGDGDHEVHVMDADGTNVRQLTDNNADDYTPRWSPEGSLIAFDSDLSSDGHWEVYVIDVDGSNLRRVTSTPDPDTAINPVWRPR